MILLPAFLILYSGGEEERRVPAPAILCSKCLIMHSTERCFRGQAPASDV